ncbi:MAG TPA: response regulator [Verrucomicrobiae bacterium]|nr:response regulator [Acidobacteriota bacterium]HZE88874.1 response regulator [Verrucomicrobiae bacterium]
MNDRLLTTSEVAQYCQVTNDGVVKWIKAKKLKAYSTPGGHYRIRKSDFKDFLGRYGMPVDPNFFVEEKKRILVVDDESSIVEVISQALSDAQSFQVNTAHDGYEAGLKIGTFRPDLIILDIMMPHMDGIEVCKRIKGDPDTETIKVVAITGHPEQGNIDRAYRSGADLCLMKPLQIEHLRREVARLLEQAA